MAISEIRRLLKIKGWSPTKLAAELHVSESAVLNWLAGRRKPNGTVVWLMEQWLTEAKLTKA